MSSEPPTSFHVPASQRRRFVAACCSLWIGAAGFWWLCASFRRWEDVKEWTFGGFLMVLVLIGQWLLERRLRRKWLPFQGQTLWCLRAVMIAPVMAFMLVGMSKPLGKMIPGYFRAFSIGTVMTPGIKVGFIGEARSAPGAKRGGPLSYIPEKLRLHPADHPERSGWSIRRGEHSLKKDSGEVLPWTGVGLADVLEDLQGQAIPPGKRLEVVAQLDRLCAGWQAGKPFDDRAGLLLNMVAVDLLTSASDYPPKRLPIVLGGVVLLLTLLAIHFIARATMGEEFSGTTR